MDGWHERRHRGNAGLGVLIGFGQVLGCRAAADGAGLDPWAYALLIAGPVALMFRKRWPVASTAVAVAATVAYPLGDRPAGPFFLAGVVALVSLRLRRPALPGRVLAHLGFVAYVVLSWPDVPIIQYVWAYLGLVSLLFFAEVVRVKSEERAQYVRMRAEQSRRQASEERLRIARELHDVLGHHLSLINVQAGVGLHLMDSRPEQAREALTAIKSASAEALREVRAVLGALRPDAEEAPREPTPGLATLGRLTEDAGIPVRTEVVGEPRPVPAEVDRAAYRIVQEALTNVRRHAGGEATATVTLEYAPDELRVAIADDGAGPSAEEPDDGNGIAGMRARAQALGGTLEASPGPTGGFLVEAVLPVGAP